MRISQVTGYRLSSPIQPPREYTFYGGTREIMKRDVVLVTVVTTDGEIGYAPAGASNSAMREYFAGTTHGSFVEIIEEIVAPTIEGVNAADRSTIHDLIAEINIPEFLRSQAIGAIDIALHDIVGKRRGVPIHELLLERSDHEAGPTRSLPLYASGGLYQPPEQYAAEARSLEQYGFSGYKFRPGLGPEADRRALRLVDEAVSDEMDLMVDAHTWWKTGEEAYSFDVVANLVADFAEAGVSWIEEPVAPDAYDRYRNLRSLTDAPIAAGENEVSPAGLKDLAATGAVDFLQGDVRHHRGFTGCWEVVQYCVDHDVTFAPHHFGTQLGLVANAHLAAAAPESGPLAFPVFENSEYPGMYPFPLATDILESPLDPVGGELSVPDDPGLGVSVDLDVISDYEYEEGPWTAFHFEEEPA